MLFHFYSFAPNRLFKRLPVICLIVLSFTCFQAKAQNSYGDNSQTYGVALIAGYDVPTGNLAYTFKPALTYGLKVLKYYDNITGSLSFGYHVYKPKQDVFYYSVNESNYGTVKYKNFSVSSIYLGLAYNYEINNGFKVYGGFDLGAYFTHLVYHSMDEFSDNNVDLNENEVYLAPKVGLTYPVSDNITLGVEGKYNLFSPAGQSRYNSEVGTLHTSYAGGLVLTYNF
jgi:hypothetical protein